MRLHRFYLDQKLKEGAEITVTDPGFIHQLGKVFRFQVGAKVILFDGSGLEYEAEIVLLNKKEVSLKLLEKKSPLAKPQGEVTSVSLYLAIIKKSNFELAVEKCTEIGVAEIQPIISERSEKKDLNFERLNKIVKEASEQSGQVTIPKVLAIKDLKTAIAQAVSEGRECVTFHTANEEGHNPLNPPCQGEIGKSSPDKGRAGEGLCLFVGPEGGWSEKEIELFKQNNFHFASLGQNILRAETAAMIAVWQSLNN